jgi:hypothetical protein
MAFEQFTTEELTKIRSGDLSGISTEKLELLRNELAAMEQPVQAAPAPVAQAPQEPQEPAPTQRLRATAQGLTLGSADEIEARLRSAVTGRPYEEVLAEIRGQLRAYQQQAPLESLGYEAFGGVLPAAAITAATGGTAAPVTAPMTGARVAPLVRGLLGTSAIGGAQGGVTGFMTGEGDIYDRLSRIPQSTVVGATVAPGVQLATMAVGGLTNRVLDFARRMTGGRGGRAVEAEIQRLAQESGMTTDEIVDRIARGEIMAENQSLLSAVRGLYAQGGQAGTTIGKALRERPDRLRSEVLTDMQQKLVGGLDPTSVSPRPQNENVLRYFRATDDAAKAIENEAYKAAYSTGGVIDANLIASLTDALKRSPSAIRDINDIYVAQTGKKPFFSFDKKGEIVFARAPTLEDAEIIRRGLQTTINQAYTSGRGGVGEALKPVEDSLRDAIDNSSSALSTARQQAATRRTARDAFKEGRNVFTKSADEVAIYAEQISNNPGALNAFRAGTMDAIRTRMGTGRANSMMGLFANPNTKEGAILRTIYPMDELEGILTRISTAAQSQAAKGYVIGGPSTAPTLLQAARTGTGVNAEELASAAQGNPFAQFRVASKLIGETNKNMSERDRNRVAQILVSEDPALVRNALVDESGMAMFQQAINRAMRTVGKTLPYGAGYLGATFPRRPEEK